VGLAVRDRHQPRSFSQQTRDSLRELAERASRRLHQLRDADEAAAERLASSVGPAFGELRNLLVPLCSNTEIAELLCADLASVVRASSTEGLARGALGGTATAFEELMQVLEDVRAAGRAVQRTLLAMEAATVPKESDRESLAEIVDQAGALAHHATKLVGGVRWENLDGVWTTAPRASTVSGLAVLLNLASGALQDAGDGGGLVGRVRSADGPIHIELTGRGLTAAAAAEIERRAASLLRFGPFQMQPGEDGALRAFIPGALRPDDREPVEL
jgi:hypothetical protein